METYTHNANVPFSCRLTWKLNIKELETTKTAGNEAKRSKKKTEEEKWPYIFACIAF